jgi:hypothetical protein
MRRSAVRRRRVGYRRRRVRSLAWAVGLVLLLLVLLSLLFGGFHKGTKAGIGPPAQHPVAASGQVA